MRSILLLGALGLMLSTPPALAQGQSPTPQQAEQPADPAPPRQPVPPQSFRSPEDGFAAFAAAARAHDDRRMLRILGEEARRLVRSGEAAADRAAQARFAEAYAARAEIVRPSADRAVLQIGPDGWPFPIPMVRRGNSWRFDARQGVQELVDRRIGRNELDTIQVLRAVVAAQDEYARTVGRQGAFGTYARRLFSSPGQRDGLYWPTQDGEAPSPLGPLVAAASAGGYTRRGPGEDPRPFHGYLFRLLEAQGPAAPGGAMEYTVNGRLIGGFGVIATPARWGETGIQTFIVSHAGTVYQRNLGPETARIARGITAFDPEPGWERVPPPNTR